MKKLGLELNSKEHWEQIGATYAEELKNEYHTHRLRVIHELIPPELFTSEKNVFEFGCGDAVIFPSFLKSGAHIEGIDISNEMIKKAHQRLGKKGSNLVQVGDVNLMKKLKSKSFDAVISFNVLAYLTDKEEEIFYTETSRIIKPGGYLVVTHSNELFDMFSLNKYTVEFYKKNFVGRSNCKSDITSLLNYANKPDNQPIYNIRENPLTYRYKLAHWKFREINQEFINLHDCPPLLLKQKNYPNTLGYDYSDKWKLMFICSTFGSCSVKE